MNARPHSPSSSAPKPLGGLFTGRRGYERVSANGPAPETTTQAFGVLYALLILIALLTAGALAAAIVAAVRAQGVDCPPVLISNARGDDPFNSDQCPHPPRLVLESGGDIAAWRAANERNHRVLLSDGEWIGVIETGLDWDGVTGPEPYTIVFAPGFTNTAALWVHQLANTHLRSLFRMIAVNYRGHGGDSSHPPNLSSYTNGTLNALDVQDVFAALNVTRPPVMVAFSAGVVRFAMNVLDKLGPGFLGGIVALDGAPNSPAPAPRLYGDFIAEYVIPILFSGSGTSVPSVQQSLQALIDVGVTDASDWLQAYQAYVGTVGVGEIGANDFGVTAGGSTFGKFVLNCTVPPELSAWGSQELGTGQYLGINEGTGLTVRAAWAGSVGPINASVALAGFDLDKVLVLRHLNNRVYIPGPFRDEWVNIDPSLEPEDVPGIGHGGMLEVPLWYNARICAFMNSVHGLSLPCALSLFEPALPLAEPIVPWFDREFGAAP